MTPPYHHLCLVSAQPVPNYLPVFHPALRAAKVTLAVTDSMKGKAEALRQNLEGHGIQVESLPLGSHEADFPELQQIFLEWYTEHETENLMLNITGGTKPMAIAAQEVFRIDHKPVFYVDINQDRIWLYDTVPDSKENTWQLLDPPPYDKLKLPEYVALYGGKLCSYYLPTSSDPKRSAMAKCFAKNAQAWQNAMASLNSVATNAEITDLDSVPKAPDLDSHDWNRLVETLRQSKLVVRDKDTKILRFASEDALNFAKGGWLEIYLAESIRSFYPNKDMTGLNVVLSDATGSISNEFDVLVVYKGSLFAFECKNRNFFGKAGATEAIYKLDSLKKNIGGLRATGIIVSVRPLSDSDRNRAKINHLALIGPEDLHPDKIRNTLKSILEPKP